MLTLRKIIESGITLTGNSDAYKWTTELPAMLQTVFQENYASCVSDDIVPNTNIVKSWDEIVDDSFKTKTSKII
jgi:hypothetical protein